MYISYIEVLRLFSLTEKDFNWSTFSRSSIYSFFYLLCSASFASFWYNSCVKSRLTVNLWIKFYLLHIGGIKSHLVESWFSLGNFQLEMDQLSMRTYGSISPIDRIYKSFLFFVVISNGLTYFQLIKIMHLCGVSSSLMNKLFWNRCWFGIRHPSKSPLTQYICVCVYICADRERYWLFMAVEILSLLPHYIILTYCSMDFDHMMNVNWLPL